MNIYGLMNIYDTLAESTRESVFMDVYMSAYTRCCCCCCFSSLAFPELRFCVVESAGNGNFGVSWCGGSDYALGDVASRCAAPGVGTRREKVCHFGRKSGLTRGRNTVLAYFLLRWSAARWGLFLSDDCRKCGKCRVGGMENKEVRGIDVENLL